MVRDISLANKVQLLFGAAVALIILAALAFPWILVRTLIDAGGRETSRQIALLWPNVPVASDPLTAWSEQTVLLPGAPGDVLDDAALARGVTVRVHHVAPDLLDEASGAGGFVESAVRRFQRDGESSAYSESITLGSQRVYRFARALRDQAGALTDVVWVEHASPHAAGQLLLGRAYLLTAALFAGALAVLVFYLITTRLILSPVRELRETAERIASGDRATRAEIATGDEFEQLADAFNEMLTALRENEERLRQSKRSLDLKVAELEQSNISLHESAKLRADFVASVSHELRTPLNSIIGFAELLHEIASRERGVLERNDIEIASLDPQRLLADLDKRGRYLQHIIGAGRSLLEMINELLDMARIEAGKVELNIEPMSVSSACEGLIGLIRPQADRKGVELRIELAASGSDLIYTDPRKFQQIVFNLLSNAVKFTPPGGTVTLRDERIVGADGAARVRVSVLDTGPGIAPADQQRIFEKFVRLESGHAREHAGTGLGLAICRELAMALGAEIQLESELGGGSMFSLVAPVECAQTPERPASPGAAHST